MVSFTGSTRAGKRVSRARRPQTVKRVALELGGKSANVILDDADLERPSPTASRKCFLNSGQTCSALTRMLVPRERLAEAEAIAAAVADALTVGDPFDREHARSARSSPTPSASACAATSRRAIEEGAQLVDRRRRGARGPRRAATSCSPTVFADVDAAT